MNNHTKQQTTNNIKVKLVKFNTFDCDAKKYKEMSL